MKAGFIGTGSMGSILIEACLRSGALRPEQLVIANRTKSKAETIARRHPGVRAVDTNAEAAVGSDLIFLCVKPSEFKHVLEELRAVVTPAQLVISITSPLLLRHLEGELCAKVAKVIPSITNRELSGVTLCIYGERLMPEDRARLDALLAHFSKPLHIEEHHTRIASDLSSCGPAFVAFYMLRFIEAAVEEAGLPEETARALAAEMLLGTAKLLTDGQMCPEDIIRRVSVPGGITAAGIQVLDHGLSGVLEELVQITHAKFKEDLEKIEQQYARTEL